MKRGARGGVETSRRERLRQLSSAAAALRDQYPQLAEVRVAFEFQDGGPRAPSPQSYSYFPAANGFFRYACPCHSCSGEFDLTGHVEELARKVGRAPRVRSVDLTCEGQRIEAANTHAACPISVHVVLTAVLHPPGRA